MDRSNYWPMMCVGMWTAAVSLMAYGTLTLTLVAAWWGLMVALGACCATGWIIASCATAKERLRVDEIAEIVAREMARQSDVHSIRR